MQSSRERYSERLRISSYFTIERLMRVLRVDNASAEGFMNGTIDLEDYELFTLADDANVTIGQLLGEGT